ncbi:MAG: response regulator [Denitromonas halophila]|uniref:Response regulator n=3 Tax=Denitromonas TaxID=139331 RepID=A0A558CJ50_9RHOO|nr:response regulator [Denitromonas ohlonensis]TVO75470.1 response regulator [Denitromonas ohlonensis]TVT48791.1 MAG: response regulator [Denitromonas halophila]TVT70641.1 MAG: response regulator [Denitromonas halophila]TVT75743.1 MAG: response regulator [Denitromonas halophila]
MIVDDAQSIRNRICRLAADPRLPELDIVGSARNGATAVRIFRDTRPQLVTMDLTMPEMDGVECTAELCAIDPAVAILVVSALTDKFTAIRALENGARGFLEKPFTDDELVCALIEVMK